VPGKKFFRKTGKGKEMKSAKAVAIGILLAALCWTFPAPADDSDTSQATLSGLKGVYVLVENIQPNIQKYEKKAELGTEPMKNSIEKKLAADAEILVRL
jgi:hypothetical protein